MTQDLKLDLIQWILEIQNPELLQRLWAWKEEERKARKKAFLASYGAWQEDEERDLMKTIYESRHFEERNLELENWIDG